MSLATRCPVCQTVFRVVQDQLKVSEGWVRCGRCAKVFNAFEGLFDLEREFPALRGPTPSQRVLEDLATRNRQAKPPSPWGDDFEGRAAALGNASAPSAPRGSAAPPPSASAAAVSAPTAVSTRPASPPPAAPTPTTAAVRPAPTTTIPAATSIAATLPAAMSIPAAAGTTAVRVAPLGPPTAAREPPVVVPKPTTPAARDEGATVPPIQATGAAAAQRPAAPSPAPTPAATAAARLAPGPADAKPAARVVPDVDIRDEPAPMAGAVEEKSATEADDSFEALFRSDGELAEPITAGAVDIDLQSDIEPASLDDAVDSRLLTFVQQADRAERWRRPGVRLALAVASLLLALLLAAQLIVVQRDTVAAQWPAARPLAQSLCAALGCRIEPLRRIDQLSVDSSGLTRIDDGPVYRLALVLRNRSDTALLLPAIDLSLTDAAGALVARRMLTAADLGATRSTIAGNQELPLQALLMSNERALNGYTIEIFYP